MEPGLDRSARDGLESGMTRASAGPAEDHRAEQHRASADAADPAVSADVLARAAAGDDQAWRRVLEAYGRRVFAMAFSRLRDPDIAEELTQAVFVKVAEQWASGDYTEQGRFESWLFRITMNQIRDEARKRRRRAGRLAPAGSLDTTPNQDEPAPDKTEQYETDRMRAAIEQLSESDRDIITLRHQGGMGFKAMAALLNEPVGTLLARHHRALKKLRTLMETASDANA